MRSASGLASVGEGRAELGLLSEVLGSAHPLTLREGSLLGGSLNMNQAARGAAFKLPGETPFFRGLLCVACPGEGTLLKVCLSS